MQQAVAIPRAYVPRRVQRQPFGVRLPAAAAVAIKHGHPVRLQRFRLAPESPEQAVAGMGDTATQSPWNTVGQAAGSLLSSATSIYAAQQQRKAETAAANQAANLARLQAEQAAADQAAAIEAQKLGITRAQYEAQASRARIIKYTVIGVLGAAGLGLVFYLAKGKRK